MINEILEHDILKHAQNEYPRESCGLIVSGEYKPCVNVAQDKKQTFVIAPSDWQPCDAVVHSHPEGQRFLSGADRIAQVRSGVPWWIAVDNEVLQYPCVAPLKGREFEYGVYDCCSIVESAYALAGLPLKQYARTDEQSDIKKAMIVNSLADTGFYNADTPQAGDVIVTSIRGVANHASVYLGDETVLHHPMNQLSRVEKMGGIWHKAMHSIWRHKDWTAERITGITNDLEAAWPQ